MKVRIGIGSVPLLDGPGPGPELAQLVDAAEERGIDSLWLADQASTPGIDPLVGMGFAVARTERLKVGSGVLILPGRNPAMVAASLASLAALAPKRILPAFGVRAVLRAERDLFPVPDGERAAVFEEALVVVRRLLSEPRVTHHGRFFHLDDASIGPLPPRPLDIWLGGQAPAALRRIGQLADGWLGAFVTPEEAGRARAGIERAAADAGRVIEDDHYGTNLAVLPDGADGSAALAAAARRRPEVDPTLLVAHGWAAAADQVRRFVEQGITKFVVRPGSPVASWPAFLDAFTDGLQGLEKELSTE